MSLSERTGDNKDELTLNMLLGSFFSGARECSKKAEYLRVLISIVFGLIVCFACLFFLPEDEYLITSSLGFGAFSWLAFDHLKVRLIDNRPFLAMQKLESKRREFTKLYDEILRLKKIGKFIEAGRSADRIHLRSQEKDISMEDLAELFSDHFHFKLVDGTGAIIAS